MNNVEWLADIIYEYPTEIVTRSGCEGLAKHLIENGVKVFPDEKYGRWIIHSSGRGRNATNWAECSECRVCGSPQWKVCPVCEARMENHSAINIEEVDFDYAAED
jgi:uncharacterized membrane protein